MTQISRKYNFQDGTKAIADQVDEELNQLVDEHNTQDTVISGHITKQVDPTSSDATRDKHVSNLDIKSVNDQISDLYTGGLDPRYYTKAALEPFLSGGDTLIQEEVFTIVNPDNGAGAFTYTDKLGATQTGTIDVNGFQIFTLQQGFYQLGGNRIYALINDTLRRSPNSGGLLEVDGTHIGIIGQLAGAEITFVYFQRTGLTGEHNVIIGTVQPPQGGDNTLWFKVVE